MLTLNIAQSYFRNSMVMCVCVFRAMPYISHKKQPLPPVQRFRLVSFQPVYTNLCETRSDYLYITGVLICPQPDLEENKVGIVRGTHAISTKSRRELSPSFFFCKARRRRKFSPFRQKYQLVSYLVGLRTYQHPCMWADLSNERDVNRLVWQTQFHLNSNNISVPFFQKAFCLHLQIKRLKFNPYPANVENRVSS